MFPFTSWRNCGWNWSTGATTFWSLYAIRCVETAVKHAAHMRKNGGKDSNWRDALKQKGYKPAAVCLPKTSVIRAWRRRPHLFLRSSWQSVRPKVGLRWLVRKTTRDYRPNINAKLHRNVAGLKWFEDLGRRAKRPALFRVMWWCDVSSKKLWKDMACMRTAANQTKNLQCVTVVTNQTRMSITRCQWTDL